MRKGDREREKELKEHTRDCLQCSDSQLTFSQHWVWPQHKHFTPQTGWKSCHHNKWLDEKGPCRSSSWTNTKQGWTDGALSARGTPWPELRVPQWPWQREKVLKGSWGIWSRGSSGGGSQSIISLGEAWQHSKTSCLPLNSYKLFRSSYRQGSGFNLCLDFSFIYVCVRGERRVHVWDEVILLCIAYRLHAVIWYQTYVK